MRERSGCVPRAYGNSNEEHGDDGADCRPIERQGSLPARETQRREPGRGRHPDGTRSADTTVDLTAVLLCSTASGDAQRYVYW